MSAYTDRTQKDGLALKLLVPNFGVKYYVKFWCFDYIIFLNSKCYPFTLRQQRIIRQIDSEAIDSYLSHPKTPINTRYLVAMLC